MTGEVLKIHPLQTSRNGNSFIRITFTLFGGKWAKTDVCPNFRNYKNWKPVIEKGVGTKVTGLNWRNEKAGEINADSPVMIL